MGASSMLKKRVLSGPAAETRPNWGMSSAWRTVAYAGSPVSDRSAGSMISGSPGVSSNRSVSPSRSASAARMAVGGLVTPRSSMARASALLGRWSSTNRSRRLRTMMASAGSFSASVTCRSVSGVAPGVAMAIGLGKERRCSGVSRETPIVFSACERTKSAGVSAPPLLASVGQWPASMAAGSLRVGNSSAGAKPAGVLKATARLLAPGLVVMRSGVLSPLRSAVITGRSSASPGKATISACTSASRPDVAAAAGATTGSVLRS